MLNVLNITYLPWPYRKTNPIIISKGCQLNSTLGSCIPTPPRKWYTHINTNRIDRSPKTKVVACSRRNLLTSWCSCRASMMSLKNDSLFVENSYFWLFLSLQQCVTYRLEANNKFKKLLFNMHLFYNFNIETYVNLPCISEESRGFEFTVAHRATGHK